MQTIVLIGPPGSGKTACGRALAERLGWRFLDLDQLIEAASGRLVPEIFAGEGEPAFRRLERAALEDLADRAAAGQLARHVVGLGGGAPCQPGNLELARQIGEIVCLVAPLAVLTDRLAGAGGRPLLAVAGGAGTPAGKDELARQLGKLLQARRRFYQAARWTIDTAGLTAGQVAEEIVNRLNISR